MPKNLKKNNHPNQTKNEKGETTRSQEYKTAVEDFKSNIGTSQQQIPAEMISIEALKFAGNPGKKPAQASTPTAASR